MLVLDSFAIYIWIVIQILKIKGDFLKCGNLGMGRALYPVVSHLCRPYPRQHNKAVQG